MWYAMSCWVSCCVRCPIACREYALTHHGRKIAKQEFCEGGKAQASADVIFRTLCMPYPCLTL